MKLLIALALCLAFAGDAWAQERHNDIYVTTLNDEPIASDGSNILRRRTEPTTNPSDGVWWRIRNNDPRWLQKYRTPVVATDLEKVNHALTKMGDYEKMKMQADAKLHGLTLEQYQTKIRDETK